MATLDAINAMIAARDRSGAAEALQKLVRKKSKTGVDWRTAISLANSLGDQETAALAAERWRAAAPKDLHAVVASIEALGSIARHKEAATLAKTLQQTNASADGYYLEGVFRARMGARDEALPLFRAALKANPAHSTVWEQIALLDGYEDRSADIDAMRRLVDQLTAPAARIPLCYALGRAFDYADETDIAFQWFSAGAALRNQTAPYDVRAHLAYFQRLASTFSDATVASLRNETGGENMLFVLGAPRSGSTLLEQILAMADGVTPTGEHHLMRLATWRLGSGEPSDMERAKTFARRDWRQMAQTYLTGIRKRFGAGVLYTDKSMLNPTFAGFIRILLPQAKFLRCIRDPRDVAWSCFRSRITGNAWAQNLDTCAQYLKAHAALCAHWEDTVGDAMHTVVYEDFVANSDAAAPTLFAHAGVETPSNWREFHAQRGGVATASLAQVRRPLNTNAVSAWRRYEKHLAPIYDKYFA